MELKKDWIAYKILLNDYFKYISVQSTLQLTHIESTVNIREMIRYSTSAVNTSSHHIRTLTQSTSLALDISFCYNPQSTNYPSESLPYHRWEVMKVSLHVTSYAFQYHSHYILVTTIPGINTH